MSHHATNWAIRQKGLKPATKIVLWHLADCHNPAHGCFPSQEYLADACEMSRSSINNHLAILEGLGLIKRIASVDETTKRQRPTQYHLSIEGDEPCAKSGRGAVSKKQGEPCPKNGKTRVQNLDTNPVNEPLRNQAGNSDSQKEADFAVRAWLAGKRPDIPAVWVTKDRLERLSVPRVDHAKILKSVEQGVKA